MILATPQLGMATGAASRGEWSKGGGDFSPPVLNGAGDGGGPPPLNKFWKNVSIYS